MIKMRYSNALQYGDLVYDGHHLEIDDGLETAVLISLYTDRRVSKEEYKEAFPNRDLATADLRGWWCDSLASDALYLLGSKLWLLEGSKINAKTAARAKDYIDEALLWMKLRGIAERIEIETYAEGGTKIYAKISIFRPGEIVPSWSRLWEVVYAA